MILLLNFVQVESIMHIEGNFFFYDTAKNKIYKKEDAKI